MDISIIILNTNDRRYLEECLESLRDGPGSRQVEVIVVDNASTDGSLEMVETRFPFVRLIKNKENLGFTRGNNVGIKACTGRYIFILNSDIRVLGDCIDKMAAFLDRNPDVGLAGPRILNADLTLQCTCRRNPTLWNNFCQCFGLAKLFRHSPLFSGEEMFYFNGDGVRDVDILVGCFSAVRRTAMDKVGLLDENFYMYRDDVDWCMRYHRAGWRVVFNPAAEAVHYGGTSTTRKDVVRYSLLQQRSVLAYWKGQRGTAAFLVMWFFTACHQWGRLATGAVKFVLRPGARAETRTRLKVSWAAFVDLFGSGGEGRSGKAAPPSAGPTRPPAPGAPAEPLSRQA